MEKRKHIKKEEEYNEVEWKGTKLEEQKHTKGTKNEEIELKSVHKLLFDG